ncbi:glutaredoxin-like protein C5orf63 homolog isoform X2 [Paroedura picta]|uniref:glutaredoxin-like protein C5orf63 homolog isoform X2 n=1 Tax=Paroedura picta TaxID=143630 RepID=UPI004055ACD5
MFQFQSWTLQLAKHSSSSLQRLLCEAVSSLPVLTLFTKKPCPLCDEAKAVLEPYKHKFILQEVDITLPDHIAWYERYKHDIPVFHLNGQFLMKHRMDIEMLKNQLRNIELQDGSKRTCPYRVTLDHRIKGYSPNSPEAHGPWIIQP